MTQSELFSPAEIGAAELDAVPERPCRPGSVAAIATRGLGFLALGPSD